MNVNWIRIASGVASGAFGIAVIWGAYNYYFAKPTPIVNNYTVQPGANLNQTQNEAKPSNGLEVGAMAGPIYLDSKIGGFIGGMVSYKF